MSKFSRITGSLAMFFIAAPFVGMFCLYFADMAGLNILPLKWDFMGLSILSVGASVVFSSLFVIGAVVSRDQANG